MTNLTNNKAVLSWIDEMTAITKPDKIVWITGEEEQLGALREQAVAGVVVEINEDVVADPALVNAAPFADGWLIKVEVAEGALDGLLDRDGYVALTEG